MTLDLPGESAPEKALVRLIQIAQRDTGQARKVADFLLTWHNAPENGGWNPVDLWSVDQAIAEDMLAVLQLLRVRHCYPGQLGLAEEMQHIWQEWRGERAEPTK